MSDIVPARLLTLTGSLLSARDMPGDTPGELLPGGDPAACAARGGVTMHKGSTTRSGHRRSIRFTSDVFTPSSDFRA
jgi:hypothetical protein